VARVLLASQSSRAKSVLSCRAMGRAAGHSGPRIGVFSISGFYRLSATNPSLSERSPPNCLPEIGTRGQRYLRGTIQLDFVKEQLMRNRGNRGNHGRLGRNDWHQRAAEFHDLAAHAHRVAAARHGQEDHQTGHEFSKRAMEYSAKAYQSSQEAHQRSGIALSGTGKTAGSEPAKRANDIDKRGKKKR
jgi:hypothetical protein